MQFRANKNFWKILASFSTMAFVGLGMVYLSWQKWPDILVDFGWQIYVPWQISMGRILYLDIDSILPPLSPYLNALLFNVFGVSLLTLAGFNLVLVAALTCLIYLIFIKMTDRIVATAIGTTFLGVFAFSQYVGIGNYNYVTPYAHEVTHGILLSFFSVYSFFIYFKNRHKLWPGVIGLSLGLVFLTKIEIFLPILLAVFTGFCGVILLDQKPVRNSFKELIYLPLGFLLPVAGFTTYFSYYMPMASTLTSITDQYQVAMNPSFTSNPFYFQIMGTDAPLLNLRKLFLITFWEVFALIIFFSISYGMGKIPNKKLRMAIGGTILGIFVGLGPYLITHLPWLEIFRPLPLFMIGFIGYLFKNIWCFRKDQQRMGHLLPTLVLAVFSLALLLKMILNVHIHHYGFALAMPATLVLLMVFLYHVPNFVGRKFGNGLFFRLLGIVAVGVLLAAHVKISKNIYDLKTYAVGSNYDTIMTWKPEVSPQGVIIQNAIKKIREVIKPDESFVVFPEGVTLNYLARRENPCRYSTFIPIAVTLYGEERVLNALEKANPDFVILVKRDTSEFGYCCFGHDYGLKIFSWIKENYDPLYLFGNHPLTGKGFGIIIAKRVARPIPSKAG